MGHQIIKQPNGLFAIFSSNTDTIIGWDYTEEDVLEYFAEQAAADARREVRMKLDHVKSDDARSAYYQFAKTWEEALELDYDNGGSVKVDYPYEHPADGRHA